MQPWAIRLIPFGTLLLAAFFPVLSWPLTAVAQLWPDISIAVIFFWLAYMPWLLPFPALIAGGFITDAFTGSPPGLHGCLYLIASGILHLWRRQIVSNHLPPMLLTFALLSALLQLFNWLAVCYVEALWLPVLPVFTQWFICVLIYPIAHMVLGRIFHKINIAKP